MSRDIDALRELAADGAGIFDIIEYLRSSPDFTLTPMTFLAIIQEGLGISFVETRKLYEYLDPQLAPLSEEARVAAEKLGEDLLRVRRTSTGDSPRQTAEPPDP